jgi:hypothetical protein
MSKLIPEGKKIIMKTCEKQTSNLVQIVLKLESLNIYDCMNT